MESVFFRREDYCESDVAEMNIDEAMNLYREADEDLGFDHRSYPACIGHLNGVVAIADEDQGSSLEMHNADEFINWMETARDELASGEWESLVEAVNENRLRPSVAGSH